MENIMAEVEKQNQTDLYTQAAGVKAFVTAMGCI